MRLNVAVKTLSDVQSCHKSWHFYRAAPLEKFSEIKCISGVFIWFASTYDAIVVDGDPEDDWLELCRQGGFLFSPMTTRIYKINALESLPNVEAHALPKMAQHEPHI